MITAIRSPACSLCSCAMRAVPSRAKKHIRGKRGEQLVGLFACLTFCMLSMSATARATTRNVQQAPCNATGNGTTDDTAAINTCIGNLQQGDTLLFPAGTYKITSSLVIDVANVTVDGSSNTATILAAFSGVMLDFGNPNGFCIGCSLGPSVSLAFTAGELWPGFITSSSLGVNPGDYLYIHQGGEDYSTDTCLNGGSPPCGGHPTNCDVSGCRGEVLQVQSVNGNIIFVTTALHDTYDLSLNAAAAQKVQNPLAGITLQNITLDGASVAATPLAFYGVVNSTVSGVTIKGANDPPSSGSYSLLANVTYGLNLNNVTLTSTAVNLAQLGIYEHGNLSINGMTISGARGGAAFFSSGANDSVVNLLVNDMSGGQGRPFKTTAVRYSTFNSVTVENGSNNFNGISIEYYSSHNTFNNCTATANAGDAQMGSAGINLFGNYNQFNTFNNCTVSGNGNVQFQIGSSDALKLARDVHNTVSGGSFTGVSNGESVMDIEGGGTYIHDATISGPVAAGWYGIYLESYATYACVNNNTFTTGSFLSQNQNAAINATAYHDLGSGNNYNNNNQGSLTPGTCP
jgi:hypothetical protein